MVVGTVVRTIHLVVVFSPVVTQWEQIHPTALVAANHDCKATTLDQLTTLNHMYATNKQLHYGPVHQQTRRAATSTSEHAHEPDSSMKGVGSETNL